MASEYSHYLKSVRHLEAIDIYRVLTIYEVTNPAIQHAVKKLLCAGNRGVKDARTDYHEAVVSILRAIAMMDEDDNAHTKES